MYKVVRKNHPFYDRFSKFLHSSTICQNFTMWKFAPLWNSFKSNTSINPFQTNAPFLYPLKTSENLQFSDVFRGYRKGTLAWNWLIIFYARAYCHRKYFLKLKRNSRLNKRQNKMSIVCKETKFWWLICKPIKGIIKNQLFIRYFHICFRMFSWQNFKCHGFHDHTKFNVSLRKFLYAL